MQGHTVTIQEMFLFEQINTHTQINLSTATEPVRGSKLWQTKIVSCQKELSVFNVYCILILLRKIISHNTVFKHVALLVENRYH